MAPSLAGPGGSHLETLERLAAEAGAPALATETLIYTNSNRIVRDVDDRVLESRRRFESQIRSVLGEVAVSAEDALARAKHCRARGSQAVQHEVGLINTLSDRLDALGLDRKEVRG